MDPMAELPQTPESDKPIIEETVDVIVAGSGGALAGRTRPPGKASRCWCWRRPTSSADDGLLRRRRDVVSCNAVLRRSGADDTVEAALTYFRAVVGDRTPGRPPGGIRSGGAELIDYLEADPASSSPMLPWPDYFREGAACPTFDGLRHIVAAPLPGESDWDPWRQVRGPLDNDRLGAPAPDLLTGGRALIGRFRLGCNAFRTPPPVCGNRAGRPHRQRRRVTGAVARRNGKAGAHRRTPRVLLAAGGFEHNAEMRSGFGVPGRPVDSMGAPGTPAQPTSPRCGSGPPPT